MRRLLATAEFQEAYHLLPVSVQRKLDRQTKTFLENPFHPSLHTEKLEPRHKELWSFRIDKRYRVLFRFDAANNILLITAGSHDWVYRFSI